MRHMHERHVVYIVHRDTGTANIVAAVYVPRVGVLQRACAEYYRLPAMLFESMRNMH